MQWHAIADFPHYEVSYQGHVRRVTGGQGTRAGTVLRPRPSHDGYQRVTLYNGTGKPTDKYIHCLVMECFVGCPPEGHEVNHIDGDKTNNSRENLEYTTHAENVNHSKRTLGVGFQPPLIRGEAHYRSKFTEKDVRAIRLRADLGETSGALARYFDVSRGAIRSIVDRKTWKHVT